MPSKVTLTCNMQSVKPTQIKDLVEGDFFVMVGYPETVYLLTYELSKDGIEVFDFTNRTPTTLTQSAEVRVLDVDISYSLSEG